MSIFFLNKKYWVNSIQIGQPLMNLCFYWLNKLLVKKKFYNENRVLVEEKENYSTPSTTIHLHDSLF